MLIGEDPPPRIIETKNIVWAKKFYFYKLLAQHFYGTETRFVIFCSNKIRKKQIKKNESYFDIQFVPSQNSFLWLVSSALINLSEKFISRRLLKRRGWRFFSMLCASTQLNAGHKAYKAANIFVVFFLLLLLLLSVLLFPTIFSSRKIYFQIVFVCFRWGFGDPDPFNPYINIGLFSISFHGELRNRRVQTSSVLSLSIQKMRLN